MTAPLDRALFLDRDGVINVDKQYVHRVEDFEFMPGIFELCAGAIARGYQLVVVTNQAGIGRGLYTEADFHRLTQWMLATFKQHGIDIARVYHCPFHPTAGLGEYRRESFDRKPQPGMLLKARDELQLDLSLSVFIGDKASDMAAGLAAGVGHLIQLVATAAAPGPAHVLQVDSLQAAAEMLFATPAAPLPLKPPGRSAESALPADRT